MLKLARKGKRALLSRNQAADPVVRKQQKKLQINRFYNNLQINWNREAIYFAGFLILSAYGVFFSRVIVGVDAQCDVRAHLKESLDYNLPVSWDFAANGSWLELPRYMHLNTSSENTLVARFSVCTVTRRITDLIMATRGSPAHEQVVRSRAEKMAEDCVDANMSAAHERPYEAQMYWRCLFPDQPAMNGHFVTLGADYGFQLAWDGTYPVNMTDADGYRATCHMTPMFGADYILYLKMLQDAIDYTERAVAPYSTRRMSVTSADDRIWRVDAASKTALVNKESFASELDDIEKQHGRLLTGPMSDQRMLSLRRYNETLYKINVNAFVPWIPCPSYINNKIEFRFPQRETVPRHWAQQEKPRQQSAPSSMTSATEDGHSKVLPQSVLRVAKAGAAASRANPIDVNQRWRVRVADRAAKELENAYREIEADNYNIRSDLVVSSSDDTQPREGVRVSHAFCEDATRAYDASFLNDTAILEILSSTYVHLESELGVIERPVLQCRNGQCWEELSEGDFRNTLDECSTLYRRRSFVVQEARLGTRLDFVFDATRHGPTLHLPSSRLVPKHMQCLGPAIQYTEEMIKHTKARALDYLTHDCLLQPSYTDVHYDYAFVRDPALMQSECKNGMIHHRWTGMACGKLTSSLAVTTVQDTEPPVVIKEQLHGLRHFDKDGIRFHVVSDCLWPFEDASSFQRINGRAVFCFKDTVQRRMQHLFGDACQAALPVRVAPLWKQATLMRCDAQGTGRPNDVTDLTAGCELLGDMPFKQPPFFNIVSGNDHSTDVEDLCIDLQGWTDRSHLLRLAVVVSAQDECGNKMPLLQNQPQIVYTATFVNPSLPRTAAARRSYC